MTLPVLERNGGALLVRGDFGLLMGPGTPWRIEEADYMAAPDQRNADQPLNGDGDSPGHDADGGRSMSHLITYVNWPGAQAVLDREQLETAWATGNDVPGSSYLVWQEDGLQRMRFGRCRGVDIKNKVLWYKTSQCNFRAFNPRSYGVTETLYAGLDTGVVTNAGPRRTIAWRVTLVGPCNFGVLEYGIGGGKTNILVMPDLVDGETLVIDALLGEANITDGDGNVRAARGLITMPESAFPARFITLPAEAGSNFAFTSSSGTSVIDVAVRDCYP